MADLRNVQLDMAIRPGDIVKLEGDHEEWLVDEVESNVRWFTDEGGDGYMDRCAISKSGIWPAVRQYRRVFVDQLKFVKGHRYVKSWQVGTRVAQRARRAA